MNKTSNLEILIKDIDDIYEEIPIAKEEYADKNIFRANVLKFIKEFVLPKESNAEYLYSELGDFLNKYCKTKDVLAKKVLNELTKRDYFVKKVFFIRTVKLEETLEELEKYNI